MKNTWLYFWKTFKHSIRENRTQSKQNWCEWRNNFLLPDKFRERAVCGEFCVLIGYPSGQDGAILPVSFPQIKFRQSSSECAKVFSNHNKEILINNNNITPQNECNCRKKTNAHALDNKCPITSVIYKANVTSDNDNTGNNYIGLRERNIQTTIYAT